MDAYLRRANEHLGVLGYTEHGYRHAELVARIARNVLLRLGFPGREAELAEVAGYLHDIGNAVGRAHHGTAGGLLASSILERLGMDPDEAAIVIGAIGNHEEEVGQPVSNVSAALILADKGDVHRTRVRNPDLATFDIHDRVNYGATRSFMNVNEEKRTAALELTVDTRICPLMEYFEIFLTRMIMCRRAAEHLGASFKLIMNDVVLL